MSLLRNHEKVETRGFLLLVLILITVSIGGIVEIAPLFTIESTIEKVKGVRPYTPLELVGRNIYLREGCYNCHSQMIRPFRDEAERYGHYSLAAESMYDHPFQWGSKRTGPDLARVGGKYSDAWHVAHLIEPHERGAREHHAALRVPDRPRPPRSPTSSTHLETQRTVGVPYSDEMVQSAARRPRGAGLGRRRPRGRAGPLSQGGGRRFRRAAGPGDRDGRAGRLSPDPGPDGRLHGDPNRRPAAVAAALVDTILPMLKQFWVVWLMILFVGIVAWVYWPSRRHGNGRQCAHPVPG